MKLPTTEQSSYVVVTIDARRSGGSVAAIEAIGRTLSGELAAADAGGADGRQVVRPFQQTVGDELQGVIGDGRTTARIVATLARFPCWIGIGVGRITEFRSEARLSGGEAFERAREALDTAKRRQGHGRRLADANGIVAPWPVAVVAGQATASLEAEYACALLWRLVSERTEQRQRMVSLARQGLQGVEIARRLEVNGSTVSRALLAGRWAEEQAAGHLVARRVDAGLAGGSGG